MSKETDGIAKLLIAGGNDKYSAPTIASGMLWRYRGKHTRLPGSQRTARLRKKQAKRIALWCLKSDYGVVLREHKRRMIARARVRFDQLAGNHLVVGLECRPEDRHDVYCVKVSFASGRNLVIEHVTDFSVSRPRHIAKAIIGQDLHDVGIERIVRQTQ